MHWQGRWAPTSFRSTVRSGRTTRCHGASATRRLPRGGSGSAPRLDSTRACAASWRGGGPRKPSKPSRFPPDGHAPPISTSLLFHSRSQGGVAMNVIPIIRPFLGAEEAAAASEAIASGWVAQGPRVAEFERNFAARVGATQAIAVSSCTTGLHLAMHLLGLGAGDEVVVPSLSFIATQNAVRYVGATPVFCDVEEATQNISAATVEPCLTPATRAVMVVHQGGIPADVRAIHALCDPLGIAVVVSIARPREPGARYRELRGEIPGLTMAQDPPYGTTNYQSFWVVLPDDFPIGRDGLLQTMMDNQISPRRGIMASHLEPAYAGHPHRPLPVTERLTRQSVILPLFHTMTEDDQDRVVGILRDAASVTTPA